jgi:hypothetical protein
MIPRKSITKSEGKANRNRGSCVAVAASVTMSSALGVFSQSGALAADNVAAFCLNDWRDLEQEVKRSLNYEC